MSHSTVVQSHLPAIDWFHKELQCTPFTYAHHHWCSPRMIPQNNYHAHPEAEIELHHLFSWAQHRIQFVQHFCKKIRWLTHSPSNTQTVESCIHCSGVMYHGDKICQCHLNCHPKLVSSPTNSAQGWVPTIYFACISFHSKMIVQQTGFPEAAMNLSTVNADCIRAWHLGSMSNFWPPTFPSFFWDMLSPTSSMNRTRSGLIN